DRELLERVAGDLGVRTSLLESFDEQRKGWLQEAAEAFFHIPAVNETAYVRRLVETVLALGAHGACVIVGRGAPFILSPDTTLRVRLTAPRADRVAAIRER